MINFLLLLLLLVLNVIYFSLCLTRVSFQFWFEREIVCLCVCVCESVRKRKKRWLQSGANSKMKWRWKNNDCRKICHLLCRICNNKHQNEPISSNQGEDFCLFFFVFFFEGVGQGEVWTRTKINTSMNRKQRVIQSKMPLFSRVCVQFKHFWPNCPNISNVFSSQKRFSGEFSKTKKQEEEMN